MKNLTLIIPAKKEKDSLPIVLDELEDYDCEILIVLEKNDHATIDSIKKQTYSNIEIIVISIAREEFVKEISCPKTSIGINVFISNCDKGLANYISH